MDAKQDDNGRPEHLLKVRLVARRLVEIFGPAALDRVRRMERISNSRFIARSVRVEVERILKTS